MNTTKNCDGCGEPTVNLEDGFCHQYKKKYEPDHAEIEEQILQTANMANDYAGGVNT